MVVNLCLPPFCTTVHCNKLCADGYDVTNLVSADPALRRRGFKLEYFLRPPVQVTLKFGFQVELCRVDVELWPWGMDRGQACKRLEISTSSDPLPSQNTDQGQERVQPRQQMQGKDRKQSRQKQQEQDSKSRQSNGHHWRLQAQQWAEEAPDEPQQRGHAFKCQSNTESSNPGPEFKLVGRCELREETQVCFTRSNFSPRPPFLSTPTPKPANCRQEELWSRGLLSLGAVTQLRVSVPWGGAASALGLKALAVWGQPARCCPAEEVERIKRVHEASKRQLPRPVFFASSVSQTKPSMQAATPPSDPSIPEEFLDPITQEVMMLPMLLPSGVSVDNSTLEEHQKREATWGRPPNDPFTGVPFTSTSQPLPNPTLKGRIDHFLLQSGMVRKDGVLGRRGEGENPQASRLVASKVDGQSQYSQCLSESSINNTDNQYNAGSRNTNRTTQMEDTGRGHSSDNRNLTFNSRPEDSADSKSDLERRKKTDLNGISKKLTDDLTAEKQLLPQTKRPRFDAVSVPSCSSHEQRLSDSLDEALFSALQGRPSFTSNLPQQRRAGSEPLKTSQHSQSAGTSSMPTGEKTCSACSCSVSVYSKSASSTYRLTCGHLLCGSCLRRDSQPLNSVTVSTSNHILCPACQSPSPRSDIIRVHQ
ncbi:RING finger protein 37 [Plectropomus leopardus]|uniref:RING finger protein 37 n=1 Tax=Plectropomus leopardus TaxID=160734 RepID=UPI001C4AADBF|nr:RING finger protein 37 [Plectropomus leopardus]XP_042343846.1 RING finger protein 37 [Plectropomus leopardus]XP_042343847.1 RING finger protein 37 [Plectropomus leopardus]XP_042343849.1 RING finger protein 37 [Plectropomus leopardus]